jgi:hypothetical protein
MPRGTATIDFGAFPGASDTSVAVTGQTLIGATSQVEAWLSLSVSADHSADEHLIETIKVAAGNIVAGVGFTIYAINTNQINEPLERKAGVFHSNAQPRAPELASSSGGRGTRLYGQWLVNWVYVV